MSEQAEKDFNIKPGEKTRSYKEFGFSVMIPVVTQIHDCIRVKFSIKKQPGNNVAMIIDKFQITDKLGRKYETAPPDVFIAGGSSQKQVLLDVSYIGQAPMWRDARLKIILCDQNGKKYEICYKSDSNRILMLEFALWNTMLPIDEQRFINVFNAFMQQSTVEPEKKQSASLEKGEASHNQPSPDFTTPTLEEYKRAILREMMFLKNNGGRKYKVTNGAFISHVGAMYSYHFELEAELNLSDDAPISISTTGTTAEGTVLVCEGFQIIIVIDKDLGSKVSSAHISVEPWKLLEALHKKISALSKLDRIAIKLLEEGPALSRKGSYTEIPQGQKIAKQRAMQEDITVIWGPPGTGKTYTMSEIAIDFLSQGKTVLVVSHSNISVDGVVNQVAKMLSSRGKNDYLKSGKVLRYGYVREEKLARNPYAVAFNYALGKNPGLKRQMDLLLAEKDQLKNAGSPYNDKRVQIEKDLKKLRAQVREAERIYVDRAQFVATTISKVNVDTLFDGKKYDIVMFDEVSMAYVPQLLSAAAYAREHFIAVGDFRQLSPIAQSEAYKVLNTDIFSYLHISTGDSTIYSHPWLVMLNEQRRMHPRISAFPNRYVYNRLLQDHVSVKTNRQSVVEKQPLADHAMNLIDLSGTYCAASKNSDNSRFNIVSAIISFATALEAEVAGEDSIGIITPYAAQTRIIRAMIQDYRKTKQTNVVCSTVHQFQGSERNLIIFDAVESYPSSKPGWLMSKNDNGSVTRLINVAVTRARGKLITVANSRFWLKKFENTTHIFYRLIKHLLDNENVLSVKEKQLQTYLSGLNTGKNIRYFSCFEECSESLKKDLSKAKNRIIVSIPDGQLDPESEKTLLTWLQQEAGNGIRVLMKSNDYQSLPVAWKTMCWGTDDAVFPVILIDDSVVWYGVPDARLMFKDGNWGYSTVCKTIFRITGEHTVELLKSLSDLEYRTVEHQRKPLLEKSSKDTVNIDEDSDGKEAAGLSKFAEEYSKCPKCKSAMKLMRSRAGKVFLKCPSCANMEYLTPDFTNWYISKKYIRCPKCNSGLRAGLGSYGIYVKCDNGHFIKPDEI